MILPFMHRTIPSLKCSFLRYQQPDSKNAGGFTLIELLIVVAIIGILAAIAIPNFLQAQTRAKVAMAQSHMRSLDLALEVFRFDNGNYPPHIDAQLYSHFTQDIIDPLWSYSRGIPVKFAQATLTTPIPYIPENQIKDPFIDGRNNRFPGSWQYGTDTTVLNSWVLESVGPNGGGEWLMSDNPLQLNPPYAGGSAPLSYHKLVDAIGLDATRRLFRYGNGTAGCNGAYDPTNGTISDGDIVRFSGGVTF